MTPFSRSILAILTAMISIQSGASLAKGLFPLVGASGVTLLRLCFATLILALVFRPWRKGLNWSTAKFIVPYGVSLGAMNLLFYESLTRIPLGIAVAFEFTGPLAVSLFASRRVLDFIWAGLAIIGVATLLPITQASENLDGIGALYALSAGFFWAMYIVFGQRAGKAVEGGSATTLGMCVASLVVLPFGLFEPSQNLISTSVLLQGLVIALLSSALPYSLEMVALRRLPAKTFGILMSLEPAVGALSGLLILGERLTLIQLGAMGCIIAASFGASLTSRGHVPLETPPTAAKL